MFAIVCWVWYNIYKEMSTDMANTENTVPVMANQLPWNELVFQGQRTYKTLSFNWKHRGPILLYNSTTVDREGCDAYGVPVEDAKKQPKMAIVGMAVVTDVVVGEGCYLVSLAEPRRFAEPIPFKPPAGAIRIFRAPADFLQRATI